MTDGDKIVAAIFAAGMCNKVTATPADYLQAYYEILKKIEEHEKPKPMRITDEMVEGVKRGSPRKRP